MDRVTEAQDVDAEEFAEGSITFKKLLNYVVHTHPC